jgi:nucleotide-binding universal stress UspA family protein
VGLLGRLGLPTGHATKIIDGQHPGLFPAGGGTPKADMLPLPEGEHGEQVRCKRNILVAILGKELDSELVSIACNLSKTKKGSVYVAYGIEVPRKLAIDAEMPAETQSAGEALERAAEIAQQMGVRIEPEIIQSRHYGQSLVDEAEAHDCALLILGLPYRLGVGGQFDLGETAEYVLKNARCRVWLVRGQQPGADESAERPESVGAAR